ncbi:uncharacterized protein A4U43_C02F12160 [Asparagus officinalis]|uniref:Light-regulated protein n=2 Tax=Asparagus officinalis TaxID=4686 RepID=A0A5P1FKG6_ASPOF|nr:uncharacterized protein A4U43_C02F12160 [Asparagus officinalis]
MQAANLCFTGPLPVKSTKFLAQKRVPTPSRALFSFKAVANTATESSTVDYNTLTSVFPVEACDIIGGDACMGVMCPEAKISSSPNTGNARASEEDVEREYFEYSQQPKT